MAIDYDRAAAEYEASLVTKLRGHGAGSFLENWVPDPDPALGIFNMIEAAWTGGETHLELLVSCKTLDAQGVERLRGLAGTIAELDISASGDRYRVEARKTSARVASDTRQPALRAKTARKGEQRATGKTTLPVEPVLALALEAETTQFTHEGEPGAKGAKVRVRSASESGAVWLAVGEDDVIRAARHQGVRPEVRRRLLELMCREIEGRTVQDASDHAAVLVIHRLRQRADARPAAGILLPANAGSEVVAALELLRDACREYEKEAGGGRTANFFERGPATPWRALPLAEKARRAAEALDAFCRTEGIANASVKLGRVEKDIHGHEIRVIIQMDGVLQSEGVPFFLRRLERYLKANLESALQVYLEPLKDKNVLRRL